MIFIKIDFLNVERGFDTSNYELVRPLAKGKNKNVSGLMKGEIGGKNIKRVLYINGVASSKRQKEKFEILWSENFRVLKKSFCKILRS